MAPDLVLHARRAMLPGGEAPATVLVTGGKIDAVLPYGAPDGSGADGSVGMGAGASQVIEIDADAVLLPGLVDSHVHVNEPGRTEWEGFASASRAAAAGGVTTIIDMPLNSLPPTVDAAALAVKRAAAHGRVHVDVGFWGGAVPGNAAALPGLAQAGVFGFKCFLSGSGVPEFPPLDLAGLDGAMHAVAALDTLLVVHAEDATVLAAAPPPGPSYADFLGSRPPRAETSAVEAVIAAARRTGARAHVLHLSCADALPALAAARLEGVRITAETCPHYLALAAADVPASGTEFKCCPPVRDAGNRERLWAGLLAGHLDAVVSDHSPAPAALKAGGFAAAWGGIASLQLGLAVVWSAARQRGVPLADVVRWMATGPADLVGLPGKGRIAAGCDADVVELAADEEFVVDPGHLYHRHPLTPYAGRTLAGVVRRTWLRGRLVDGSAPAGELITPGARNESGVEQ